MFLTHADYETHPETKPLGYFADPNNVVSDYVEVVGTIRVAPPATGRTAVTVTKAASGAFYTADAGFGTSRDMKTRAGCIKWLKKVLAHHSLDAKWYA